MKDHIVKWYGPDGNRHISEWMEPSAAFKLSEELIDNNCRKIVIEQSHVCGHKPIAMFRC